MADIFFTSADHRRLFLITMLTLRKIDSGRLDPEYASAVYILTSSTGTWQKAESYVGSDGIDFEALFAQVDWSGGYSALIRLAGNLFNDRTSMSPVDLMRLDDRNFAVAMTAFQIRRRSLPLSELASKKEIDHLEMDVRNSLTAENRPKPWLPFSAGEEMESDGRTDELPYSR